MQEQQEQNNRDGNVETCQRLEEGQKRQKEVKENLGIGSRSNAGKD